MKKLKLLPLILIVALALCAFIACEEENTEPCVEHVDENGDGKCDKCSELVEIEEEVEEPQKVDYSVTVTNGLGTPISDLIITLYKGDEQISMKVTDENGKVSFNAVEKNSYTYTVVSPSGEELSYEQDKCILNETTLSSTTVCYDNLGEEVEIYGSYFDEEKNKIDSLPSNTVGNNIVEGVYVLNLSAEKDTFLVFIPHRTGKIKVSLSTEEESAKVGYYGTPGNVLAYELTAQENVIDAKNFYCNVRSYNVGENPTPYALKVTTDNDCKAILSVSKYSDLEVSVDELPWSEYMLDETPEEFVMPYEEGAYNLVGLDITDENLTVVYNENDGYYHLNDVNGSIVYVAFNETSIYQQWDVETTWTLQDVCANGEFRTVVYDEEGNFVKKQSYNEAINAYIEKAEENHGLYYLTPAIEEAIKTIGESKGWWDFSIGNESHIFLNHADSVVVENAWLFSCYVLEEK